MNRTILPTPLRWSASLAGMLLLAGIGLGSCSDDYEYESKEPDFLGTSIYDYLQQEGDFKTYLKLVDDLDYRQVLKLTGSKTVFPARDDAWRRFFESGNPYGVTSYEQLTAAQKRSLLNASTINMAYLAYMLANTSNAENQSGEGTAVRRATQCSYLDSIRMCNDTHQLDAPFWTKYKDKRLRLADNGDTYMVHFTPQHTAANNIPSEDLSMILGREYNSQDVYINGTRIIQKDITCKNGYVHVVEDVLTPNAPMSDIIDNNGQTDEFARLMERFSAPFYSSTLTDAVHQRYDGSDNGHQLITDSIFVKRYFTEAQPLDPSDNDMTNYGLLYFDPADNSYSSMQDMGVMFVPTDQAMEDYINGGNGTYLKDAYGSWDNVPTGLMALFVKNHQKKSFMSSLPSMWSDMNDESSFAMNVSKEDIVKTYVCGNGIVYITNKVYPPIDYQSVYASVMTNEHTKIMNWALQDREMKFYLYLRSMENMYNLLVPTDEALDNYRDPISWAKGRSSREIWSFRFDATKEQPVTADVYSVNDDGTKGEYKRTIEDAAIIRNRLNDICDCHIIVGNKEEDGNMSGYIDDGSHHYYKTKGGSTIRVDGSGKNMTARGGGDTEQGMPEATQVGRYDANNGRCYIIDRVIHDPVNSVYTNMQAHQEFSRFFELLNGNDMVFRIFEGDPEIKSIFSLNTTTSSSGLGNVVNSFCNFQYTVFVPTNDAIDQAFESDPTLHTWDEIAEQTDATTQRQWALRLTRFLRYHFVDNSTYVDAMPFATQTYETAARSDNGRFQKISISGNGQNLNITDAKGNKAHIVKKPGLFNLQSRDITVNSSDYRTATQMVSSSQSVIHLIDRALIPE